MTELSIGRELGRGDFGVVFEAQDPARGEVALKILAECTERARAQFQAVSRLEHPNLVRLYEWIDGKGFTMERVRGKDLLTHVRDAAAGAGVLAAAGADVMASFEGRPNVPVAFGQRLQPEGTSAYQGVGEAGIARLRGALSGLISGLKCLHDANITHGDVRPSNVMVTGEGRVVLLDFGMARTHDDGSPYESSAAYAPPELSPSPAADWYAVGTLVFECLTGQLPFFGSAQHVLVTKATIPPPRPSFLVRGVPDDLDDLVAALLSRDPARRVSGLAGH